ncbi:MAG: DUF1858 domain-containing protein [Ignavibacteriae bacterium]|nr:DUF1858 domain-containing protein [Ignavibacteriota bacterium]
MDTTITTPESITMDTTIEDLVTQFPATAGFLMQYGVRCLRCGEPLWGTLGDAMKEKGITGDRAEAVLAALRKSVVSA